jgi:hypothetical protein
MIRAMLQDVRTGSAMAGRRIARRNGIWEVLVILAAVVPCGILAGLYLATEDARFIIGCAVLAVLAVAIILLRNPAGLRLPRWRPWAGSRSGAQAGGTAGSEGREDAASRLRRIFTTPLLKIIGVAAWLMAWSVTAALYARIFQNANIGALVMLVAVGGFSPVLLYFGLEGGIKKLSGRMRRDE